MKLLYSSIAIALVTSILAIATKMPSIVIAKPAPVAETSSENFTTAKKIAAKITVRIKVGDGGGSGVLLTKKGNTYMVLTNAHVVNGGAGIKIRTPDGQSYTGKLVPDLQVGNFDLALVEFTSTRGYELAKFDNFDKRYAALNEGREIFGAGFPYDANELRFVEGEVTQLPQEPFRNGTQIGYVTKIDLKQGMSGGPILDSFGNLVGINSTLSQPIISSYLYADGSKAPQDKIAEYRRANWGVPIYNLLSRLNRAILHRHRELPQLPRSVTPSGYMAQLDRKARQVTVRIENADGNGSGVIIAKDGRTYSLLTADHVVKNTQGLKVTIHDQRTYLISPSQITRSTGTDLAVVKFTSTQPYQVATLGNYIISESSGVFAGGWPAPQKINSQQWQWQLNVGAVQSQERGQFQAQDQLSFSNGYDLIYSSVTYGGMSGGPVFDRTGRVIGIHGKAEGESDTGNILGESLGISIKTFLGLTNQLQVNPRNLQIATTRPAKLDSTQIASINPVMNKIAIPENNNQNANQWIEYGNQLYRQRKYVDAVKSFDRAIALQPNSIFAYYGKGLAFFHNSNSQAALSSFDRAIQLVSPANKSKLYYLWNYRSLALSDLNRYPEALVAISQSIELAPQDLMLLNNKADIFYQSKQYPEGIAVYSQIIDRNRNPWAYANRGIGKARLGDSKGAIADYDAAIRLNPQFSVAYDNRGISKSRLGDKKGAIADHDRAININPQFANAYVNRGLVKSELKDLKSAIVDYNNAISINPQFANAYQLRGLAKSELKDLKGAIVDYDNAIRLKPQDAYNYGLRGLTKSQLGDNKSAIIDYDTAIRLNSQDANVYVSRGLAKSQLGDKKGAIADLNIAAKLLKAQNDMIYYQQIISLVQKLSK